MTPSQAIQLHNDAYGARDADTLLEALAPGCLYEMPLLRSRMVGRHEIAEGLRLAFAATTGCTMAITRIRESGDTAIAEGVMTAQLARERETVEVPFALVAQAGEGGINRISVYLDAKPFRLWADGPILALAG